MMRQPVWGPLVAVASIAALIFVSCAVIPRLFGN